MTLQDAKQIILERSGTPREDDWELAEAANVLLAKWTLNSSNKAQLDELHDLLDCIHIGERLEMEDYLAEVDEDSLGTHARVLLDFMLYHRDMRENYEDLLKEIRRLPTFIKP